MKVIEAGWEWEHFPTKVYERIERIARTCYKSEDRAGSGTAERMCRMLRDRGHLAMFDHVHASVRFITNRGVSHELVRHRIAAYAQESTRYCNYSKGQFDGELTFINPCFFELGSDMRAIWLGSMKRAELDYLALIDQGATPQEARDVLPNALKTEIVATFDFTEWRHVFSQRAAWRAHPQMRQVMVPVLIAFRSTWPAIFDDIHVEEHPA